MPDNLTQTLSIGSVDDEELIAVLGSFFPRGTGNIKTVEYQNEQKESAITLTYKEGVIVDTARGPALTEEKLDEILAKIESAILREGANKVNRSFLFSCEILEGTWNYNDRFQIMPAPIDAPKPKESYAEHPFVLEVSYIGSLDQRVEQVRLFRKLYEMRLLLHLFLNGYVIWQDVQGRKKWAFVGSGADFRSEWLQLGYAAPSFQVDASQFSDTSSFQALSTVDVNEYFSRQGIRPSQLEIPANLEALFDAFYALPREDREQFLRACFWYYTAGSAAEVTSALQYNCLVTAIETLMGDAEKTPCEYCGKDTSPGPTGKFKSFLQTYAPGSHNAKDRDAFYSLRSKLSHGSRLFRRDLPRALGTLHPTEIQEWSSGGHILRLTRIGLTNWMMSRTTTGQTQVE
jgi:hypothetical protein